MSVPATPPSRPRRAFKRAAIWSALLLTADQTALAHILAKMDETPIGKALNDSAARSGTLWCMNHNPGVTNYGQYRSSYLNFATLTPEKFGGSDKINSDPVTFNRALRTAYEESAHAWQDHRQHALKGYVFRLPHHQIADGLAVEAAARVTAYAALMQHRAQGDTAPWTDNYAESKNQSIMRAMDQAMGDEPDITKNLTAQWAAFDKFYDVTGLVLSYQGDANVPIKMIGIPIPARDFERFGSIPGGTGNYIRGNGFSPDLGRYGGLRDTTLRMQYELRYAREDFDPAPLNPSYIPATPARPVAPTWTRRAIRGEHP